MADIVLQRDGGGIEIRDLKSGMTLDDEGTVSESYRMQLLLYATMYEETFGAWPEKLVIDPLLRDPIEIEPDRSLAIQYRDRVLLAMNSFDQALADGHLERLARPSEKTCRFCPHVSVCQPFWSAADPTWGGRPRALRGRVVRVEGGETDISVDAGTIPYGEWTIGGTAEVDVVVADRVQVVGFERRRERRLALIEGTTWESLRRDRVSVRSDVEPTEGPIGGGP